MGIPLEAATIALDAAITCAGLDPSADRTPAWWDDYEAACLSSPDLRRAEEEWVAASVADAVERNRHRVCLSF